MITSTANSNIFTFPCGEVHLQMTTTPRELSVVWEFEDSTEIMELLLLCDAAKRQHVPLGVLEMPYVPFSRQDKVHVKGEPLSIAVLAQLINACGFRTVNIMDPHSDVTPALFDRCYVVEQHEIFAPILSGWEAPFHLISPDGGALKKIYKLAKRIRPISVIEASKQRDVKTGDIMGTMLHGIYDLDKTECVIVDDICDGGKTFIELAKILMCYNSGPITLMVTHGFFTKGINVFDKLIDHIYTRKGQVK